MMFHFPKNMLAGKYGLFSVRKLHLEVFIQFSHVHSHPKFIYIYCDLYFLRIAVLRRALGDCDFSLQSRDLWMPSMSNYWKFKKHN